MAGITSAVVGLAGAAASVKKQKDAKKAAEAAAKAAEAQARAEEAKAAAAAAAQPAQPTQVAVPQAQPYGPVPYGQPAYWPAPGYAPQPYPGAYYAPAMPTAGGMSYYGGGGRNRAAAQSRTRENLTATDARSLQLAQFRQLLDQKLTEARTKQASAEANYRTAYSSGNRASAQAWYQYHQQLGEYISQLETQKIQYAA